MTLDIKTVISKCMNKAKFNQNFMQVLFPLSFSLFEFFKSPVVIRSRVFNTVKYNYVNFFIQRAIKVSSNDIDIVKVLVQVSYISKENLEGRKLGNR